MFWFEGVGDGEFEFLKDVRNYFEGFWWILRLKNTWKLGKFIGFCGFTTKNLKINQNSYKKFKL